MEPPIMAPIIEGLSKNQQRKIRKYTLAKGTEN
jgi:hypothetical protein